MARIRTLSLWLTLGLLASCAYLPVDRLESDATTKITILHTNDHHGRFWRNKDGEYGMAARKTVIDSIRAEVTRGGGYSLLLDGGDVNTGVPESDLQDAVPDFKGMNLLGYDAMAVGNHEFDKNPQVQALQRKLAKFPMLSANIYRGASRVFEPYKIFNLGGVRIAVMGLTTEDTQRLTHPDNRRGLDFRSPIQEAAKLIPELQDQADVIVAATHMGHYANGNHGSLAPGDVEMARAVKGLHLVVGGHSQNAACMSAENVLNVAYVPGAACLPDRQNGTWIVQAHEWGKYVGRADFEYHKGVFTLVRYALIPINLRNRAGATGSDGLPTTYTPEIAEDPHMLDLLRPHQEFGQQQLLVEVGAADSKLEGDRSVVRKQNTNLGVLIGRAMMSRVAADFAVVNAGGIRDSLPAGKITYKDILTVHPFGNTISVIELSGKEALDYLLAALRFTPGSGGFAHLAGVEWQTASGKPVDIRIGGKPLEMTSTYRMAINNFVAAGGDGYPVVTSHPGYVDTGFVDAEVLRSYISARSPLTVADFTPAVKVAQP